MKKFLVTALALSSVCAASAAYAASNDDVMARLATLEKENAAIRKENAALRENKALRAQNTSLKSSVAPAQASSEPGAKRDPLNAYAADVPMAYKAPMAAEPGRFRVWTEGGAIWTGGDAVTSAYTLGSATGLFFAPGGGGVGAFDLKPKVGWAAATGFDYRFAASPWHVSGQFRYGEGGKTSGFATGSTFLDLSAVAGLGAPGAFVATNDRVAAQYSETHWIADLAVGKDIFGSGPEALQLKGGLRVSEFVGQTDLSQSSLVTANFGPGGFGLIAGVPITTIAQSTQTGTSTRSSFLGAGPLIGVEGSVPLAAGWAFDYSGDASVLFGTQKTATTVVAISTIDPAIIAAVAGGIGSTSTTTTTERFATVFSADIQVGVSYWLTQNIKLGVSYRLDAMMNVQNQSSTTVTNQTPDRYTHGPLVRLSATF